MKRSKAVVVGGAVLTLLGMLLSYAYTQSASTDSAAAATGSAGTTSAWVATQDLTIGSTWEQVSTMVVEQKVPDYLRPADAVVAVEDVQDKTLVRNVTKGEVLTLTQFNKYGVESLAIPEGTSALTISVSYPQGVGDYIQPGSKANFFATIKNQPPDGALTKLLLSDIPVLANRRAISAEDAANGTEPEGTSELLLTFAVTTEQAERIIFAQENGSVWLTLMRPGAVAEQGVGQTFGTFLP